MNQEQFGQFWAQLRGPLKKQYDKFTDDDLLKIEGNLASFIRTVDTRYGAKKGEVSTWANRRFAHWSGWYQDYDKPMAGG